MLNVGPFSVEVALLAMAVVLAWLVARTWAKSIEDASTKVASGLIIDGLMIGLLAARLAYVARWWADYWASPWSIIAIGDGGFYSWVGIPVGLGFIAWRSYKTANRWPALGSSLVGFSFWVLASLMIVSLQQSLTLPDISLTRIEDQSSTTFSEHLGKPLVINLWATWCPPCRREMPMFEKAQQQFPEVTILMVNQGEDSDAIARFLKQQGLDINNILLDPHSRSMRELGANALPTTLFFDAEGSMQHAHMGELTLAVFRDSIRKL